MSSNWQKVQWGIIVFIALLGAIWQFYPLKDASDRMNALPRSGVGYNSQEFEVTDIERQVFKDNNLLKRLVWLGGQQFFVSIVDGSKYRNAVHDPTICFLGEGFVVDRREPVRVPGGYGELIHMVKKDGSETKTVFLAFSTGSARYGSVVRYWFDTTMRRLTLGAWSEEPVRIIIQPVSKHPLQWRRLLFEFHDLWRV